MTQGNVHALRIIHKICAGCIPHYTMCVICTQLWCCAFEYSYVHVLAYRQNTKCIRLISAETTQWFAKIDIGYETIQNSTLWLIILIKSYAYAVSDGMFSSEFPSSLICLKASSKYTMDRIGLKLPVVFRHSRENAFLRCHRAHYDVTVMSFMEHGIQGLKACFIASPYSVWNENGDTNISIKVKGATKKCIFSWNSI